MPWQPRVRAPAPAPGRVAPRPDPCSASRILVKQSPAAMAEPAKRSEGSTRSIQRVFAILRVVAAEGGNGLRLTEIATRAGLHLATTHRLVRALAQERAVVYDPFSRLYHVGHDYLQHEDDTLDKRVKSHFRGVLQRIADLTHDTVFLATRHGVDALYIESARGRFPADPLPLDVGGRRPLGVGTGSLCLLAALPARELSRTIEANEERYVRYSSSAQDVRAKLRAYRRDGYAFASDTVVTGLAGVGVPMHDEHGAAVAAISVLTTNDRLPLERQQQVVQWIRREAARVGEFAIGGVASRDG